MRVRKCQPAARRVGQGVMDVNQVERPIQQRMGICLAEGRDIWVTDSWIWLEEVTGQQDDYEGRIQRGQEHQGYAIRTRNFATPAQGTQF